jgi:hypothetical protein
MALRVGFYGATAEAVLQSARKQTGSQDYPASHRYSASTRSRLPHRRKTHTLPPHANTQQRKSNEGWPLAALKAGGNGLGAPGAVASSPTKTHL